MYVCGIVSDKEKPIFLSPNITTLGQLSNSKMTKVIEQIINMCDSVPENELKSYSHRQVEKYINRITEHKFIGGYY